MTCQQIFPYAGSHTHRAQARERITFYHKGDPYYGFTNFSAHVVGYEGKTYPTAEHLFQSLKVTLKPETIA